VNYVNQRTSLFNDTVIKNIKYGNIGISDNDVDTFIKKYGLDSVYSKLNDGIYSSAGVSGANLSLGMQKVTLVLRGIFKKGDILIMDEPLTGLDKNTKEKVINMINDLPRSKTIIIITHDKEILQHLDNVYDLNNLHKGITKE
jgi:ABC-type transport system involved in cytochrome bd biosynthesis fused ATPase/permease subunit